MGRRETREHDGAVARHNALNSHEPGVDLFESLRNGIVSMRLGARLMLMLLMA